MRIIERRVKKRIRTSCEEREGRKGKRNGDER